MYSWLLAERLLFHVGSNLQAPLSLKQAGLKTKKKKKKTRKEKEEEEEKNKKKGKEGRKKKEKRYSHQNTQEET